MHPPDRNAHPRHATAERLRARAAHHEARAGLLRIGSDLVGLGVARDASVAVVAAYVSDDDPLADATATAHKIVDATVTDVADPDRLMLCSADRVATAVAFGQHLFDEGASLAADLAAADAHGVVWLFDPAVASCTTCGTHRTVAVAWHSLGSDVVAVSVLSAAARDGSFHVSGFVRFDDGSDASGCTHPGSAGWGALLIRGLLGQGAAAADEVG